MERDAAIIAVCGLDCAQCNIYRAAHDPALARRLTEAFKARGRADAVPEWFKCSTCRGERSECWSDSCWIRECCVDERGLEDCSHCAEFPCDRLSEWASGSERYAAAIERLRGLARSRGSLG